MGPEKNNPVRLPQILLPPYGNSGQSRKSEI